MESSFQQQAKDGRAQFKLRGLYPEYRKKFEMFKTVFGSTNVRYWRFDPDAFPSRCVVCDFAARFGVPLTEGQVVCVNEELSR